jgi:hypothetical protein
MVVVRPVPSRFVSVVGGESLALLMPLHKEASSPRDMYRQEETASVLSCQSFCRRPSSNCRNLKEQRMDCLKLQLLQPSEPFIF